MELNGMELNGMKLSTGMESSTGRCMGVGEYWFSLNILVIDGD